MIFKSWNLAVKTFFQLLVNEILSFYEIYMLSYSDISW